MVVRPPATAIESAAHRPRRYALHYSKFCPFSDNRVAVESATDRGRPGFGKPRRGFRHNDVRDGPDRRLAVCFETNTGRTNLDRVWAWLRRQQICFEREQFERVL